MADNTVTHVITVSLDNKGPFERLKMPQADSGRILEVHTTFAGAPLAFPDGTVVDSLLRVACRLGGSICLKIQ